MSKYYLFGGIFSIGGVALVLCQAISSMMTPGEIVWKRLSIVDIVGAKYINWLDGVPLDPIQSISQYITTMPLYILLVAVGIFLFIVGGLVQE